jgi:hypothetical protein
MMVSEKYWHFAGVPNQFQTRPSQAARPLVKSAPGALYPSLPNFRKKGLEKK